MQTLIKIGRVQMNRSNESFNVPDRVMSNTRLHVNYSDNDFDDNLRVQGYNRIPEEIGDLVEGVLFSHIQSIGTT